MLALVHADEGDDADGQADGGAAEAQRKLKILQKRADGTPDRRSGAEEWVSSEVVGSVIHATGGVSTLAAREDLACELAQVGVRIGIVGIVGIVSRTRGILSHAGFRFPINKIEKARPGLIRDQCQR